MGEVFFFLYLLYIEIKLPSYSQNKQENYRKKEIVDITNTELDVIEYRIKTQQEEVNFYFFYTKRVC
jgi:hypothetical protein